jgi:hypothetical protein
MTSISSLTTRETLNDGAGRMQKLIEAAQRKLEHAHGLSRLARDFQDDIIRAAQAASLAEDLMEHVSNLLENKEGEQDEEYRLGTAADAIRRPWYYIERAFEIDGQAGPQDPSINSEFWGDYDAIPIAELAHLVGEITKAECAVARVGTL